MIDPLADIHPLLLSSNGAVIADPATGRVLHHWPIDPADGLAFGAALVRRVPDAGFRRGVRVARLGGRMPAMWRPIRRANPTWWRPWPI